MRNDIVEKLSSRREIRKTRRNRLRYRPARFSNRVHSKHRGWLAPSVEQKINSHIQTIKRLHQILPISKIIVETAQFDIQKIKNPNIEGEQYQQGDQMGFWNMREYVLFRDNHQCQHCKGKSKDNRLNVHHIESRKTGGNAPNNLITLCETCHNDYHQGKIKLNIKRGKSFRDAAFMGIMRKMLLLRLRQIYPNVQETFGYITKNTRIENGLPKEHYVDARCISGSPLAKPLGHYFYQKYIRRQNRKMTKDKFIKGGIKKNNQLTGSVFGFDLFDAVEYQKKKYFVFGRRKRGDFDIRTLDGKKINSGSTSYKKLKLIQKNNNILTERSSSMAKKNKLERLETIEHDGHRYSEFALFVVKNHVGFGDGTEEDISIQVVAETDADAKRVARDVLYDENGFRVSDVFEQEIAEAESFWMEEWGR